MKYDYKEGCMYICILNYKAREHDLDKAEEMLRNVSVMI